LSVVRHSHIMSFNQAVRAQLRAPIITRLSAA
jgi:hypothetical protein